MVQIVRHANRHLFARELDGMHRDRKRVFVDWLKWNIPVTADTYEIDQFDTEDAVYLIEAGPDGQHLASIRLLPSARPHLLSEVFADLCEGPVPRGRHIWELTRFCVSPDWVKRDGKRLMNLMWTSSVEFAVKNQIREYTCVTHLAFLSQILAAGWDTTPLGLPKLVDGGMVGAVLFRISEATLKESRARFGFSGSVFDTVHKQLVGAYG